MFNEVQGLLHQVTGGGDGQALSQAVQDHLGSMSHEDLKQHLQTAADNASASGQGGIAQQIMGLLGQHGSNPGGLKSEAISMITSNPQILEHFAPDFAKGLLSRI